MSGEQSDGAVAEAASGPSDSGSLEGGAVRLTKCLDCGAALRGRFCSACGQRVAPRLSFRQVLSHAVHQLLDLDFATPRTVAGLSWNPGRVAREYVDGRRRSYLNPLKYAFIATTFYVFLTTFLDGRLNLLGDHPVHPLALLSLYLVYLGSGSDTFPVFAFAHTALPYLDRFVQLLPYATFLFLLPLAPLQRRFFGREAANAAECYVFLIYVFGHLMLIHLLMMGLGLYQSSVGYVGAHVLEFGFLAWGLAVFHRTGVVRSAVGALVLMISHRFLFAGCFLAVLWLAA